MLISIISSLFHELGHIVAMIYKKHEISKIYIGLFRIDITDNSRNTANSKNDIFILVSGSAVNFVISIFCYAFCAFNPASIIRIIGNINILIGILNLLPISHLDGGQIMHIFLNKYFKPVTSDKLCFVVSLLFLFPLSILGFFVLISSKYNFSLLAVALCLILATLDKLY